MSTSLPTNLFNIFNNRASLFAILDSCSAGVEHLPELLRISRQLHPSQRIRRAWRTPNLCVPYSVLLGPENSLAHVSETRWLPFFLLHDGFFLYVHPKDVIPVLHELRDDLRADQCWASNRVTIQASAVWLVVVAAARQQNVHWLLS